VYCFKLFTFFFISCYLSIFNDHFLINIFRIIIDIVVYDLDWVWIYEPLVVSNQHVFFSFFFILTLLFSIWVSVFKWIPNGLICICIKILKITEIFYKRFGNATYSITRVIVRLRKVKIMFFVIQTLRTIVYQKK